MIIIIFFHRIHLFCIFNQVHLFCPFLLYLVTWQGHSYFFYFLFGYCYLENYSSPEICQFFYLVQLFDLGSFLVILSYCDYCLKYWNFNLFAISVVVEGSFLGSIDKSFCVVSISISFLIYSFLILIFFLVYYFQIFHFLNISYYYFHSYYLYCY